MEPAFRAFAVELIEKIASQGECDFVHAFAEPFPIITFMRLMGMDTASLPQCRSWARDMLADDDELRAGAFSAVGAMMGELLAARRAEPRDDLISRLITSEIDGKLVTPEDAVGYCLLLFIAGLDTVANALAFGMSHLAGDPALQARLRAEPERIADAVEELLRLYGVAIVVRLVTRDVSFGGVELKSGDRVMLLWPAVNYDPAVFTDPACYDFERAERRHLTFSAGPHRCAGSHLARLELRLFYEEWFRRMPEVRPDPEREAITRAGLTFGLDTLPIVWLPK
jgi:cytochrome P450